MNFYKEFTKEQVFACAIDAYKGISTHKDYSAEERRETMEEILTELGKDYRSNKNKMFAIIEATLTEVLPQKVNEFIQFAEVKHFKWGETMRFKVKSKQIKAYAVALGATVKRNRMDHAYVTIEASNIQAKVYEEEMNLRINAVNWVELVDACIEAIADEINALIYRTFLDVYSTLPSANKHEGAGVDEAVLNRHLQIVSSYGTPVIFGTRRGLAELPLDSNLITDQDKADLRDRGFVGTYKGAKVYEIKNPVADVTNAKFAYDDSYLFVIPTGKENIVKVGFEGDAIVREKAGNDDWTVDFDMAQRLGVAVLQTHFMTIYKNTNFGK